MSDELRGLGDWKAQADRVEQPNIVFDFVNGEARSEVTQRASDRSASESNDDRSDRSITDDARYFTCLRVIARLMAVSKVSAWWPGAHAGLPADEREVIDHARALVDGYNPRTGERKVVG